MIRRRTIGVEARTRVLIVVIVAVFFTIASTAHGEVLDVLLQLVEDNCGASDDGSVVQRVGDWILRELLPSALSPRRLDSELQTLASLLTETECHGEGMVFLGDMFREGRRTTQDYAQAFSLYQRAADLGSVEALVRIGVMFFGGLGVNRDYDKAFHFYEIAAMSGSANGQLLLGVMYASGCGGPLQDYVKAHAWLNIASSIIPEHASGILEEVASNMSTTAVAEAQIKARELSAKVTNQQSRGDQRGTCAEECQSS